MPRAHATSGGNALAADIRRNSVQLPHDPHMFH
jgi:hypothetical protein